LRNMVNMSLLLEISHINILKAQFPSFRLDPLIGKLLFIK